MMDAINLCRFTDAATAAQTIAELDSDTVTATALDQGVTLHTGIRYGTHTIVVKLNGANALSLVVSPLGFDD